jgi:transcriptional regulator with XRE-family HTH domain
VRKLNSFPIARQSPSLDGFSFASPSSDGVVRHSIPMSGSSVASEAGGESETVASTLGLHMRVARQRKGLDLSQVSGSLKISKRHLNAIEEGRLDALPAGNAYLLGYTRSYASYLGLNASKFVEELKFEIAERALREVVHASRLPPRQPLSAVRRVIRLFFDASHYRNRSN